MDNNLKIGISFSGGGAKAIAHIGVIQALREHQIEANFVSGTSGGAIIGALYSAGVSTEIMLEIARQGSLLKLYKPGLPIQGLMGLDYLGDLLKEHIKVEHFEELKTPFSVVATNLGKGQKEILKTGELYPAIMASCAIPLLFNPVEINGNIYADGGIFDNMPVEDLKTQSDFIMGVNVVPNIPMDNKELDDLWTIGMRVFDMMVAHNAKINFPEYDHIIEPAEVSKYGIFGFKHAQELFEIGYQITLSQIEIIKEKIKKTGDRKLS